MSNVGTCNQTLSKKLQTVASEVLSKHYPGLMLSPSVLETEYTTTSARNFGDIQLKGLIGAAKSNNIPPLDVAKKVSRGLGATDFVEKATPEGVGYVNVTIKPSWICKEFAELLDYENAIKSLVSRRNKFVAIDYSSPNLSKELHAGHLRSTVVGDCITRVLEFIGCKVKRVNFVGDWGTQFGMIIGYMLEHPEVPCQSLSDMDKLYVLAKKKFDADSGFADRARGVVVSLQSGDPQMRAIWERIITISLDHCQELYDTLGAKLKREDVLGESSVNDALAPLVDELVKKGIAFEESGAIVALTPSLQNYFKGKPICILRKRDTGFGYPITDSASLIYRLRDLKVDAALYVVDNRQKVHLAQVFDIVRRAGYIGPGVEVTHVDFGMILGKDQKPFKSRTGGNVKLNLIINDVIESACKIAKEKNDLRADESKLTDEQIRKVGKSIAIGAIKYADLSKNRTRDYVLNLDAIISFEGDTAPYIMYAFTRSFSVARHAGVRDLKPETLKNLKMTVIDKLTPQEHALSISIIQFPEIIDQTAKTYMPHILCGHLFRVASLFAKFYETSAVIKCEDKCKDFRVILTVLTAKTLELGLNLLGIDALEVM